MINKGFVSWYKAWGARYGEGKGIVCTEQAGWFFVGLCVRRESVSVFVVYKNCAESELLLLSELLPERKRYGMEHGMKRKKDQK